MANFNQGFVYPFSACGDLGSAQYRFVTQAGANGWVQQATGGCSPAPMGVLQNDPESGGEAAVMVYGITKVEANATNAIGFGDYLTSSSNGQAVVTTTGSHIAAKALEALASGSGVYISALLLPDAGAWKGDNVP